MDDPVVAKSQKYVGDTAPAYTSGPEGIERMTWEFNGDVDHGARLDHVEQGDIHILGKIDGGSTVSLVSSTGSIVIDGKVDGASNVNLRAAGDIRIGLVGDPGDRKIDGGSHVDAIAGGMIGLGDKIDGQQTSVDFSACNGIRIANKIDGGAQVRLSTASGLITVGDKIGNDATRVVFWPPHSLVVEAGIRRQPDRRRGAVVAAKSAMRGHADRSLVAELATDLRLRLHVSALAALVGRVVQGCRVQCQDGPRDKSGRGWVVLHRCGDTVPNPCRGRPGIDAAAGIRSDSRPSARAGGPGRQLGATN